MLSPTRTAKAELPFRGCPSGRESAAEGVAKTFECFPRRLRRDLRVDLHRDGEPGVPENLHGDSRMDVQVGQERGAGAAGVVDGDRLDGGLLAPRLPRPLEHVGLRA